MGASMSTLSADSGIQRLTPEQEALVREHVEELMTRQPFAVSKRAQDLLRLIVGHALAGEIDGLRERMIGAEMFNRPVNYDTSNDSVVRVKATELRKKLAQCYLESKSASGVRIEVHPGSYVPRFIFEQAETHSQLGRKPVRPLAESKVAEATDYSASSTLPAPGAIVRPAAIRGRVLLGAAVCLLGLLAYMGWSAWHARSSARSEIRSIVVLPFENLSGDSQQDYFADGMTEVLIADLGQISSLHVISRASAMSFKGTKKDLAEIARELSVDGVVEGSVAREGSEVRITVRLIDARSDRPIWGGSFIRNSTPLLVSEGELAQSIASELSLTISPQTRAHLTHAPSVKMEAEVLYLHGMLAFHSGNCGNAMDDFQKAIQTDPNFANAYAALATCYGLLGSGGWMPYGEAFLDQKNDAARAIELDDSLSEGHAEMADALVNLNWDWSGAEKEFQKALALNPNSARVHGRYAGYLVRMGRSADAIEEAQIAVRLDPLSGRALSDLAYIYYFSRQYDQALSLLKQAQAKDANLYPDIFAFADVYAEKGMYQQSISEFMKLGDNPHALGHLGNAYARAGQTDTARKVVAQLEARIPKDGFGSYEIALIYAGLGEKNEAFDWLQKAFDHHDKGLIFLKVDPPLEPLRSDPRFDELVRHVGLQP